MTIVFLLQSYAKLVYKIAKWESNVSSAQLISFLNCPIDLIALIFSGREFHTKAPLQLELRFK